MINLDKKLLYISFAIFLDLVDVKYLEFIYLILTFILEFKKLAMKDFI